MNFTFLKPSGEVAFFRSDAEEASWTQEELNLNCIFPYLAGKVIERGMTILFQDPATNDWQAYEIRKCTLMPGDAYQQLIAEDIAVSELTDCHIQNRIEVTDVSAAGALSTLLTGTGWSIGTTVSSISSGDFDRGSVWQNVSLLSQNWNVYIMPRVTVGQNGITGRYLDIISSAGVDRGLRLAVNKNLTDPCVTYDDSELYTALYGYGGTYAEGSGESRATLEYNFSSVVWNKTADHPAKPAGQRYLEYPEMTALYGRNGKPRFGYYQNTSIDDPEILLQKTWETLKECCQPKISITGTALDLKRIGYADVPLRLHDMAIIELEPVGLLFYKQVIRLTVDLLDASKNLPEIGDYIPNIIYINRDTENFATGGSKGIGSNKHRTKIDLVQSEFLTDIYDTGREVGMVARKVDTQGNILNQAGMNIDPETGVLIYSETGDNMIGSKFRVENEKIDLEVSNRTSADNALSSRITATANQISLEVSERKAADATLSGKITIEANRITQEVTDRTNADTTLSGRINVEKDRITAEVTRAEGAESTLSGRVTITESAITQEVTDRTNADNTLSGRITVNSNKIALVVTQKDGQDVVDAASIVLGINDQTGSYVKIKAQTINLSGYVTADELSATNATISNLTSGATTASSLKTNLLSAATGFTYQTHAVSFKTITINGTTYHLMGYT